MEPITERLYPIFLRMLVISYQAGILALLILTAQAIFRRHLPAAWRHGLWFLLLLRLALPWTPPSDFSIFCLDIHPSRTWLSHASMDKGFAAPERSSISQPAPFAVLPEQAAKSPNETSSAVAATAPAAATVSKIGQTSSNLSKFGWLMVCLIWATGAAAILTLAFIHSWKLQAKVGRRRLVTDQAVLNLLEDCKEEMRVHVPVALVETPQVRGPALFGFIRPRLLLPMGSISELKHEDLRWVFLHELAHIRRRDIALNWLIVIAQALHWFNPVLWLAFYRMRIDCETASDALVLSQTQPGESRNYGSAIIHLLERFSHPKRMPAIAGILEDKSHIKRRLTMIANFKKSSAGTVVTASLVFLLVACTGLTGRPKAGMEEKREGGIDLTITSDDITVQPEGGGYVALAEFKNETNQTIPAFEIQYFLGDPAKGGRTVHAGSSMYGVGPIKPGDKWVEASLNFGLTEGGNEIYVVIDPDNKIKEVNESNNKASVFRHVDNLDLSFQDDPSLIGEWEPVDLVEDQNGFEPGKRRWTEGFDIKNLSVFPKGHTSGPWQWTKDYFLHPGDKTASRYEIRQMGGASYLFMEHKSGDYIFRGKKPWYYVYKKVSDQPNSEAKTMGDAGGQGKYTEEQLKNISVDTLFSRIGNPESGYHGFSGLWGLIDKAKISDQPTKDAILKKAEEIIQNPEEDMFRRWQSCYVISGMEDARGIPTLARALREDSNETVRGVAACALGAFDAPEAKTALQEATKEEKSGQVRDWIAKAESGQFLKKNADAQNGSNKTPQDGSGDETSLSKQRDEALTKGNLMLALDREMQRAMLRARNGHAYKDKIDLVMVWKEYKKIHSPAPEAIKDKIAEIEPILQQTSKSPDASWRIFQLLAFMQADMGNKKAAGERLEEALKSYPMTLYPDPSKHSKYQHLVNQRAELLWDEKGSEAAENFMLAQLKSEAKCEYCFLPWWAEQFKVHNQMDRYPAFLEKVKAAYAEREQQFPERKELTKAYIQQVQ